MGRTIRYPLYGTGDRQCRLCQCIVHDGEISGLVALTGYTGFSTVCELCYIALERGGYL